MEQTGMLAGNFEFYLVISPSHYGVTSEACACLSGHCSAAIRSVNTPVTARNKNFGLYDDNLILANLCSSPATHHFQGSSSVSIFSFGICFLCLTLFPAGIDTAQWRTNRSKLLNLALLCLLRKVHRTQIRAHRAKIRILSPP